MKRETDSNMKLIEECLEGDVKAQFRLYRKYSSAMFNISVRIVGNKMDAEDVLQESFITVFDRLDELENKAVFGSWLKRIVVNNSISFLRSKKVVFEDIDGSDAIDENGLEIEESTDPAIVHNAIKDLPPGSRTVLVLHALEGYNHKDISSLLGITESTSKSQYRRGLGLLNGILKNKMYAD